MTPGPPVPKGEPMIVPASFYWLLTAGQEEIFATCDRHSTDSCVKKFKILAALGPSTYRELLYKARWSGCAGWLKGSVLKHHETPGGPRVRGNFSRKLKPALWMNFNPVQRSFVSCSFYTPSQTCGRHLELFGLKDSLLKPDTFWNLAAYRPHKTGQEKNHIWLLKGIGTATSWGESHTGQEQNLNPSAAVVSQSPVSAWDGSHVDRRHFTRNYINTDWFILDNSFD